MSKLNESFIEYLRESLQNILANTNEALVEPYLDRILSAINEAEPPVSIRLNPFKTAGREREIINEILANCNSSSDLANCNSSSDFADGSQFDLVSWCKSGVYLPARPQFIFDPLFHAGAYYVQEGSSMFLEVLSSVFDKHFGGNNNEDGRRSVGSVIKMLDLCASPGGKSTHLCSIKPKGSLLVCNEVIRSRCGALMENIIKWGDHNVLVTSSDASYFGQQSGFFDFIMVDAPCSGEGMFRKDSSAIAEWSEEGVKLCAARQRRILADVWDALAPGALLAYSTCTFNRYENDDNVEWICNELGASVIAPETYYDFDSTEQNSSGGSPLQQNSSSVSPLRTPVGGCQFFPGLVRGEGFYFALLQKNMDCKAAKGGSKKIDKWLKTLPMDVSGVQKGRDWVPASDYAQSLNYAFDYPDVELSREDALKFLARETSFALPTDTPTGYVRVTYKGLGLGLIKNLGNRFNNLFPVGRRVRKSLPPSS